MDTKYKQLQSTGKSLKTWIKAHPKKVYTYMMITLLISFTFPFIEYYCFTPKVAKVFSVPGLYVNSDQIKSGFDKNEKDIEKVVKELSDYKTKREKGTLSKNDSLRIEYLFNQYQSLQNGH